MPRGRSENREKAFILWTESGGQRPLADIARSLGVPASKVRTWKSEDEWEHKAENGAPRNESEPKRCAPKRKAGAPKGNRNAAGHTAPPQFGNKRAFKHGAYERIAVGLLEADEAKVFKDVSYDVSAEEELLKLLAMLNAKEVRLLKRMNDIKTATRQTQILDHVEKTHRELEAGTMQRDSDGKKMIRSLIDARSPDELEDTTVTVTSSALDALSKIEAELDKVYGRKTKVLAQLEALRTNRERLAIARRAAEGDHDKNQIAAAWIEALSGNERREN